MVADGWHACNGYDLYVEDDIVLRAVKTDRNGSPVAASVYIWKKSYNCWVNVNGQRSYETVRKGLHVGNYKIS